MITPNPHTGYFITGVFIAITEVTHYVVHQYLDPGVGAGYKMSKAEVLDLIENSGLPVSVWEWNYEEGHFVLGKQVNVAIDYHQNKYLWINAKDPKTKNLKHLIRMDWFSNVEFKADKKL
jgi:hypothetical protein